jgi:4-alpha-glucanotransferase
VSDGTAAMAALTREAGVQRSYTDVRGRRRRAPDAAVAAVLTSLGHDVGESGAGAVEALRTLRAGRDDRPAEPVAVAWGGSAAIPVRGRERVEWTLALEGGGERRGSAGGGRSLRLSQIPPGYHTLHVVADGREAAVLVLSAPRRAYVAAGRWWGVFLPLYALPGRFGPGDFGGLRRLAAWAAGYGGGMVGSTPLFAAFLGRPFEPSPYVPVTRLFWNELYVDPAAVPELEASAAACRLLAAASPAPGPLVDYAAAMRAKRTIIGAMMRALAGARLEAFERHLEAHPDLRAYAAFRARCEQEGVGWLEWRGSRVVDAGEADPAARYHAYAQWICARQLAEVADAGAGLYLDMPLGVHPSGYDTWRFQDAFAGGASIGAPPDDFFTAGQSWGVPPLHPVRIRERGHSYPIACVRELLRHAAAARIDHVMGLHRVFWVPDGFAASDGVYVRYPAAELYAVLCIESHRAAATIVGEDLGTVPAAVRRTMSARGLLRTLVLQAEAGEEGDPLDDVPHLALVGMNTHDMPTFAGFWAGADAPRGRLVAAVKRRGHPAADEAQVLAACLDELAASDARGLMVNLEDLWGEPEPQNVPGTTGARNWRRAARHGVEELDGVPGLPERLRRIAGLREEAT